MFIVLLQKSSRLQQTRSTLYLPLMKTPFPITEKSLRQISGSSCRFPIRRCRVRFLAGALMQSITKYLHFLDTVVPCIWRKIFSQNLKNRKITQIKYSITFFSINQQNKLYSNYGLRQLSGVVTDKQSEGAGFDFWPGHWYKCKYLHF